MRKTLPDDNDIVLVVWVSMALDLNDPISETKGEKIKHVKEKEKRLNKIIVRKTSSPYHVLA